MPIKQTVPNFLLPILWDVENPALLDVKKYQRFIITRVAEKGRWDDIIWLKKMYGTPAIKRAVATSRNVSKKVKNFWKVV